jgi:hypothetical protein
MVAGSVVHAKEVAGQHAPRDFRALRNQAWNIDWAASAQRLRKRQRHQLSACFSA